MLLKSATSLAFATTCLSVLAAIPANAAPPNWSAKQNVVQSNHYDRMLETNRSFREARMRKECGPITDPQLHQSCVASFAQYEPAAATSRTKVAAAKRHPTHYVGSSTPPRQHQTQTGH